MRDIIFPAIQKAITHTEAILTCTTPKEAERLRSASYHHRRAYAIADSRAMDVVVSFSKNEVHFTYKPRQKVTLG